MLLNWLIEVLWYTTVSSSDQWIDLLVQTVAEEVADRVDTIVMWVMVSHVDADTVLLFYKCCLWCNSITLPVGWSAMKLVLSLVNILSIKCHLISKRWMFNVLVGQCYHWIKMKIILLIRQWDIWWKLLHLNFWVICFLFESKSASF